MLDIIVERIRQKYRTYPYPAKDPVMPERFRGRPVLRPFARNDAGQWQDMAGLCPTQALQVKGEDASLDMGRCTFCGACTAGGLVAFTRDWRLAATKREDLVIRPGNNRVPPVIVDAEIRALFARSFRLRQVSAAGCNACEADLNVLTTLVFDISRFGIEFVASPRHADAMAVTGPVTRNMQKALGKVDAAMPTPRVVMAVGACAISGGLFHSPDNPQGADGVAPHLDVTLHIPGCAPHPYTILDGMLRLLGRVATPEGQQE